MSNPAGRKDKEAKRPTRLQYYSHRTLEEKVIPEHRTRVCQTRMQVANTDLDLRIQELELELILGCPVE
jgi:hypothetical protein